LGARKSEIVEVEVEVTATSTLLLHRV